MCGIGGILRTDGTRIPDEWLDAIDTEIAWRGPDGQGRFHDHVEWIDASGTRRRVDVAFVHRRLSIIDHQDGCQPMVSERGRNEHEGLVAVVFNGCIYNHRELRSQLESRGHAFATDHSDTEVLIHGWREWGMELAQHLEGMFAFALWDRSRRAVIVARDWCGRKPLYVLQRPGAGDGCPGIFAFASATNALMFDPVSQPRESDASAWWPGVSNYLARGYMENMHGQMLPGTTVREHTPGLIESFDAVGGCEQMLVPVERVKSTSQSTTVSTQTIESLIEQAVQRRLEADVPLGCFVSGGVDSSLIAYFAKKHKPDLMTFSVRMPDERYDESRYATRAADHLGTVHHTLDVAMNPAEDLVHLIKLLGQPFADSSILPTYWVSKAAREHVKVALSGDGGDEIFIGYERFLAAPLLAQHHRMLAHIPQWLGRNAHPKSKRAKLARLSVMARDYPSLGIAAMESIFTQSQIAALTDSKPHDPSRIEHDNSLYNATARLRAFELEHYLPCDLLRKLDTASMAVALEVRCPFLDRDLAT
ncbi:MAG: asparagine synthase (glutamine-hydrolyzing), partial [Phycisphaerales bacterium]